MRLSALSGCALLLLAACGGGEPTYPASDDLGRLERPRLGMLAGATLPEPTQRALPLPETLDGPDWKAEGRRAHLSPVGAARQILVEAGPTQKEGKGEPFLLELAGPFKTIEFNQVALTGVFPAVFEVQIRFDGGPARPVQTPALTTRNQEAAQTILFEFEALRGRNVRFEALHILITGPRRPFALHAIDLIHVPEHHLLPPLAGEPALVTLGDESRPAQGLPPGVAAECTFQVEHAADRFTFAGGILAQLKPSGGSPRIKVTLTGSGAGEQTATLELDGDGPRWRETTLPLTEFVGREVSARFEYLCDAPRRGVVAIGDQRVWRPGAADATTLLISSDTHRADHVAAMGMGVALDTPVLDELARGGLVFEHCWATTNVTSPSHVAMLTALHPRDTRLVSNQDRLVEEARTLGEVFRDAGWRTLTVMSVRHLGPLGTNLGQGFDRVQVPTGKPWSAEVAAATLTRWIEEAEGQRVFAFLHLFDAHHPYEPPASHDRRYYPADRDPFDPSQPAIEARRGSIPMDYWGRLRDVEFPKAQYRAEVTYLDGALGPLLAHERVTAGLVAFTADHGEIFEKSGTYFNHGELYPDTLHVPLLLGGAGLPAEYRGRRLRTPVSQLGLGRTLLDLSGLPQAEFPGRNLLLEGEAPVADAAPLFALSAHGFSASMRWQGWFLVLHLRGHHNTLAERRSKGQVELFELASDPECLRDVSAQEHERVRRMQAPLIAWLLDADPRGLTAHRTASAAELASLKAMGYATEEAVVEAEPWYVPE